ncbi:GNAT family N-acetyltransferase [Pasteurellaceae bacterium LIM206]|nr:GNAT family N-acetyltransferase [Pasteurellaceae bacterium LIM206]
MTIQHRQDQEGGEFFLLNDAGEKVAELTYFYIDPKTINANHTYVDQSLRGQGAADRLYRALIAFVRENHLQLRPTCSYVAAKWQREQE